MNGFVHRIEFELRTFWTATEQLELPLVAPMGTASAGALSKEWTVFQKNYNSVTAAQEEVQAIFYNVSKLWDVYVQEALLAPGWLVKEGKQYEEGMLELIEGSRFGLKQRGLKHYLSKRVHARGKALEALAKLRQMEGQQQKVDEILADWQQRSNAYDSKMMTLARTASIDASISERRVMIKVNGKHVR